MATSRDGEALAFGCVSTEIPGWVDDMRPVVDARSMGLTASVAEGLAGAPIRANDVGRSDAQTTPLAIVDASNGRNLGSAKKIIAFDEGAVVSCFVVCVAKTAGAARACDPAVEATRVVGDRAPPPPGFALAAVTYGVHHPNESAMSALGFVVALGVLVVATRRRPRFRR